MELLQKLNHTLIISELKRLTKHLSEETKLKIERAINIALKLHWEDDEEKEPAHIVRTALRCALLGPVEPHILIAAMLRKIPSEKASKFIDTFSDRKQTGKSEETLRQVAYEIIMDLFGFEVVNLITKAEIILGYQKTGTNTAEENGKHIEILIDESEETARFLLAVLCDEIEGGGRKSIFEKAIQLFKKAVTDGKLPIQNRNDVYHLFEIETEVGQTATV